MGDNDKRLTIIIVLHRFCFKISKWKITTNILVQHTKNKTKVLLKQAGYKAVWGFSSVIAGGPDPQIDVTRENNLNIRECVRMQSKKIPLYVWVYIGCNVEYICRSTRPFGFLGVSRKAGGTNISADGRRTELTFALCGLFGPYLATAGPTLWNWALC